MPGPGISERIAPRVLCLPLFQDLTTAEQHKIISIISQSLNEVNTLAAN
jgi:dTDP-4-amino-4,6-dideoxygalactose transaminase